MSEGDGVQAQGPSMLFEGCFLDAGCYIVCSVVMPRVGLGRSAPRELGYRMQALDARRQIKMGVLTNECALLDPTVGELSLGGCEQGLVGYIAPACAAPQQKPNQGDMSHQTHHQDKDTTFG